MENDGRGKRPRNEGMLGPANAEAPRGRGERCGAGGQLGFGWDPTREAPGRDQRRWLGRWLVGSFWLLVLCRNGLMPMAHSVPTVFSLFFFFLFFSKGNFLFPTQ